MERERKKLEELYDQKNVDFPGSNFKGLKESAEDIENVEFYFFF